jgi:protoporphyrinogen oxidase
MEKKAIIIGAGPAGLTAAYELLKRTDIKPIILEKSGDIGGISKTVNYKGNRIDIGGHRFFSKSDRVMNWWMNIMPIQAEGQTTFNISYQNKSREIDAASIEAIDNAGKDPDKVMLVRRRLSRIYFLRKFFTYPIQLSLDTLTKLGLWTTIAIMFSYLKAQLLPRKPEKNLEDFMINRFGQVLYKLFFKDYTEKVWGIPCDKISAEWGAQRIKGVSISKAIRHAIQSATKKKQKVAGNDIAQKDTETSLIEQFLYPKFGPGQLWEEVARQVRSMGGEILMQHDVKRIYTSDSNNQITAVAAINNITGETSYLEGDYFFSTMPVQELIGGLDGPIPEDVKEVAAGLQYRDFITVGILLKKLSFQDKKTGEWRPLDLKDTWIYIQEKDVKVGRLQLFNNWSPYMVKDPGTVWVGMEFFCSKKDNFWELPDNAIKQVAIHELEKIGLACDTNVLDSTVLRMEKTYPAYFGTYERFEVVRDYTNRFGNLFLIGRNGMHKYNNSDHSMLTAMVAVDNICASAANKANIWAINTGHEYHEKKEVSNEKNRTSLKSAICESPCISFYDFLFRVKLHKQLLVLAALLMAASFTGYKLLFPFANFMPDSYSYIEAAASNASLNMWPIGYSKFLRIWGTFSTSDTSLVIVQYVLLQASVMYFVFTVFYFYQISSQLKRIVVLFFSLNPIFVLISNYVSADALFTSLSLLWVTQLIWILLDPKIVQLYLQAILLFLAFTVRYNALYYPLIAITVVLFSTFSLRKRLLSVVATVALLCLFVWQNGEKYRNLTSKVQFSPFGGWQLAANALYAYSKIEKRAVPMPINLMYLDTYVCNYIDSIHKIIPPPDSKLGVYYLWDGPLVGYTVEQLRRDTSKMYFTHWASVAPLYKQYGQHLISAYPAAYFRYFLLPNIVRYFAPPAEFMPLYNMKTDSIGTVARNWFRYSDRKVKAFTKELPGGMALASMFSLANVLFWVVVICLFTLHGWKKIPVSIKVPLSITAAVWVVNFVFSVTASPIVLRYQLMLMVLLFTMLMCALDHLFSIESKVR